MFFRGYTRKQWALELEDLAVGVAARIPTRTNDDDRYFTDKYQCMPLEGYTALFKNMLDHRSITVELGVDYFVDNESRSYDHVIYTGSIDKYFDYCLGPLPYRSLRFEHTHHSNCYSWQPVGTINYPNENAYTRITEVKKLTGQESFGTSLVTEYPTSEGDPYYPIPTQKNNELFSKYANMGEKEKNVSFVGRLAEYKYYNMDQVVASSMTVAKRLITKFKKIEK